MTVWTREFRGSTAQRSAQAALRPEHEVHRRLHSGRVSPSLGDGQRPLGGLEAEAGPAAAGLRRQRSPVNSPVRSCSSDLGMLANRRSVNACRKQPDAALHRRGD